MYVQMDKASIIGDAASYVNELQAQAKKLKAEVAGLEASLAISKKYQGSVEKSMKDIHFTDNKGSIFKKMFQVCLLKFISCIKSLITMCQKLL